MFFLDPMLSCKTFVTNSLKKEFYRMMYGCVCCKIEHLLNIDEIRNARNLFQYDLKLFYGKFNATNMVKQNCVFLYNRKLYIT